MSDAAFTKRAEGWTPEWGHEYSGVPKRKIFSRAFAEMEQEGKLGEVIVDVGSGAWPVSNYLPPRTLGEKQRKVITVDVAGQERTGDDRLEMRMDAEEIGDMQSPRYRRNLVRAREFLSIPKQVTSPEQVDTFIFSEVLNYVDYQKVLGNSATLLKPGGRFLIMNMPGRGLTHLFSDKGVPNNNSLMAFLDREGFDFERTTFSPAQEPSVAMLVLSAVKKASVKA